VVCVCVYVCHHHSVSDPNLETIYSIIFDFFFPFFESLSLWDFRRHPIENGKFSIFEKVKVRVKWSRYRPGVAQRLGRGIALLFHDRGTRRGWVVSSTPRPHFTSGKDPVPILQEAGWAPGPVWTGGKYLPHRDSIPDRPARSSVTIPTELQGPHLKRRETNSNCIYKEI